MATTSFLGSSGGRLVLVVGGVAVVAIVLVLALSLGGADASGDRPIFVVKQGPLTISVSEPGAITARDQKVLKCEVEGQTTILNLVDEGTRVKKGDLLVELDSSRIEDSLVDQKIRVQNGEAAHVRARENQAVAENQAKSDISRAQLDVQFAREDLKQYLEGEYPKQLKEAEARITLAKERLEQANETLRWSQKLLAEKYISQTEFEKDRLARESANLDHDLAVADRDLLINYTRKRRMAELESEIEQADLALERVTRKAKADVVQAQVDLDAKASELEQQKKRLAKLEDQLKKTKIYAPVDGMVVYPTSSRASWRGNAEPLDEGQTVRERQELINLPTTDSMTAELKLHESNLEKVAPGQSVRITCEAIPGKSFTGRVMRIAPLPDAQSRWMNPDLKVYTTYLELTGDTEGLRTGMTCRAEIIVDRLKEAVYVPVQAVVRVAGRPTAYVLEDGEVVPRAVKIGFDNNRMVHILSGLSPGEEVLLSPPLEAGTAPEPEEEEVGEDEEGAETPETAPKPTPKPTPEPGPQETPTAGSRPGDRPGGPGGGRPSGRSGGGRSGGGFSLDAMIERMDTNGDGKVELSEMDERRRGFMAGADTNGDGVLQRSELEEMMKRFQRGRGGGGRDGGGRRGGGR